MKKILMIFAMCFALIAANAQQIFLLQEGFENGIPADWTTIDADGDGYNWSATQVTGYPGVLVSSESYSNTALVGALTPDNWLITPAITIPNSITEVEFSFYAAAQDASYPAEYYGVFISTTGTAVSDFTEMYSETMDADGGLRVMGAWKQKTVDLSAYVGQTIYMAIRHYNCTDAFRLNIDDVAVSYMPTEATLTVTPTTLSFGSILLGENSVQQVNVSAYLLTEDITVTTTAPFTVSADNVTFATTATLPAAGGTLYVQFVPTTSTPATENVTLTAGTFTATVSVEGTGVDCSTNGIIPLVETFNNGGAFPFCWTVVNSNTEDNDMFMVQASQIDATEPADNFCIVFSSYEEADDDVYDQYLISPELIYDGTQPLFDVNIRLSAGSSYTDGESYAIGYSTTTNDVANFTWMAERMIDEVAFVNISELIPSTAKYVAIHYFSDYQYYLVVDEITINEVAGPEIRTDVDNIDLGYAVLGEHNTATIQVSSVMLTEDIIATTAAPFAISTDSVTFATTATIPMDGGRLFVQYTPTAGGTDNGTITLSSTGATDKVVTLTGNGVDCEGRISALPYTDDFNASGAVQTIPFCWTADDVDNFVMGTISEDDYCHVAVAPGVMISPEIEVAHQGLWASIDYVNYASSQGETPTQATVFRIGYSSTTNDIASFTWGGDVRITNVMSAIGNHRELVPAGTKYVAIQATTMGTFLYYGYYPIDDAIFFNNFALTEADAELVVNPTTIDFGSLMVGSSDTRTVNVTGAVLENAITATVTAPFEISIDNTTFAATAELPNTGGSLYVRYAPTTIATDNGTIEFASDTHTATVTLTGSSVDCATPATLPFVEDFEDALTACWQNVDADGDGYSWLSNSVSESAPECGESLTDVHNGGAGSYLSFSFSNAINGALTPNNWLVSPTIAIPEEGAYITWSDMECRIEWGPEHYELMVSTNGAELSNFTSLFQMSLNNEQWEQRTIDLADYAGQNINLAFVHNQCTDGYFMGIDDINVQAGAAPVVVSEATANTVSIYPNPVQSTLNITAENMDNVQIINFLGQVVYSANVTDTHFQINVSNLSNGVYFVRLNGENVVTKKFVKK